MNTEILDEKRPISTLRFIIGSLDIGGAERHLAQVLPELKKKGWQVRILTLSPQKEGDLVSEMRSHGIEIKTLSPFFSMSIRPRGLLRVLKLMVNSIRLVYDFCRYRKQITHFFLPGAYLLGMLTAKLTYTKSPLIMSRRSLNSYQDKRPWLKKIEHSLHKYCDVILGNSEAVVKELHDEEGVSLEKLGLIYNGTAEPNDIGEKHKANLRKKLGIDNRRFTMIVVANLIPYKGHEDLLLALKELTHHDKCTNWQLLVVGRDDGIGESLQAKARLYRIDKNILWLGARQDVSDLLSIANLGILCSHQEGFPNAVIESMMHGLPMVVTDAGGSAEAVIHQQNGLVVAVNDYHQLAKAIAWMIEHPELCHEMGAQSEKRAKEYFSIARCANQYDELYHKINNNSLHDIESIGYVSRMYHHAN